MQLSTLVVGTMITIVPFGLLLPEIGMKCGSKVAWYYSRNTQDIFVCDIDEQVDRYKNHELGHKFYFEYMTDEQRKEYEELYKIALKEWSGSFIRDYAMTTVEEDFAENFAFMAMKINQPPKIQKRIRWIRKVFEEH